MTIVCIYAAGKQQPVTGADKIERQMQEQGLRVIGHDQGLILYVDDPRDALRDRKRGDARIAAIAVRTKWFAGRWDEHVRRRKEAKDVIERALSGAVRQGSFFGRVGAGDAGADDGEHAKGAGQGTTGGMRQDAPEASEELF